MMPATVVPLPHSWQAMRSEYLNFYHLKPDDACYIGGDNLPVPPEYFGKYLGVTKLVCSI